LALTCGQLTPRALKYFAKVNAYWFPDTYLTLAKYFTARGVGWSEVDAKTVLGSAYSSAAGFKEILKEVEPVRAGSGGGGCGA